MKEKLWARYQALTEYRTAQKNNRWTQDPKQIKNEISRIDKVRRQVRALLRRS